MCLLLWIFSVAGKIHLQLYCDKLLFDMLENIYLHTFVEHIYIYFCTSFTFVLFNVI